MWIFIDFLKFTWFYWPSRHHTYLMTFHLCIYIFMYLLISSYIWVYDWCKIGVVKIFLTVSESNWCKLIVTKLLILVLARYFLSKNGVNLLHHKICLLFSFWISFVKRSSVTWLYNSIVIFIEDDPWYPAMFLGQLFVTAGLLWLLLTSRHSLLLTDFILCFHPLTRPP